MSNPGSADWARGRLPYRWTWKNCPQIEIDQRRHFRVRAGLSDDRPTVGVADENDRPVLRVDHPPSSRGVTLERQRWVLHDGDMVAVLLSRS